MNRQEFEHIVRAAAGVTGQKEFIVIGSQSILGKFPDAPRSLRHSMELDLYPKEHPELAELISGCLGEYSTFHDTFKYYADGVSPTTATLPPGWQERLVRHHFIKPSAMTGLIEQTEDPALKQTLTERWQVIHGKRLSIYKPTVRPPGNRMGGV